MTVIKQYNSQTEEWEAIAVGQKGDTGEGVAEGGTEFQLLEKASGTDFDTRWVSAVTLDSATLDKSIFNVPAQPFADPIAGELQWNLDVGTLEIGLNGGTTTHHLGQKSLYYVKNQSGSSIPKGSLVTATGTVGASGRITIGLWTGQQPVQTLMGITTEAIPDGDDGFVAHFGRIRGVNTTGAAQSESWADGDILYAGPSGGLTKVVPQAPNTKTIIALVLNAASNGSLFVRPTFSSSLDNDDLVQITDIADNDVIRYNSAAARFENVQLGSAADADTGDFATSIQGSLADTALQPNDNVSELTNDADYIDAAGAPVQSVNTKTGTVVLDKSDVGLGNVTNDAQFKLADAGTMATQNANDVAITGGTVNATTLQQGGSQAYVRNNILGTVSQSAGVPTGAVIESGSNVNGVFTKYANGTVIAFQFYQNTWAGFQSDHTVEFIGFNEWPEQTPLRVSGGPTNAAPVSFVGEPYSNVVGGRYADSGNRWVIADSLFDQDITAYVLRKSSSGLTTSTSVRFRRIYIGRWF